MINRKVPATQLQGFFDILKNFQENLSYRKSNLEKVVVRTKNT
ncbi:hypothetical protein SPAR45_1120 [Streptococcus pneumoniae GA17371]|nr:hypothetical protein SPAR45_1120 [Streptococcus pneumoniae GA17371]